MKNREHHDPGCLICWVAIQNGLIKTNGTAFNPQAAFTRFDLSRGMAKMATLASQ
jgi:hypothetical protein